MAGVNMPQRWDAFHHIQREVGRFLETLEPWPQWRAPRPYPPINLYDAPDRFILTAELPGVAPEQLDLTITGETLTLRGERLRPEGVSDESYRRQERQFGRWVRSLTLPERINGATVTAGFSHGILTVHLPKADEARPRHITVSTTTS